MTLKNSIIIKKIIILVCQIIDYKFLSTTEKFLLNRYAFSYFIIKIPHFSYFIKRKFTSISKVTST